MNRRDQELLDKQLRRLDPPRHDGTIILMVVATFFAGLIIGGVISAHEGEPMRIASNDATAAFPIANVPPPSTPQ
ncbi:MAG TPA: hypothetical protein VK430_01115 [Xanthobacteraceae bacterium]|nr:hypothetical protein [Xanthobacteraceae bacterium]